MKEGKKSGKMCNSIISSLSPADPTPKLSPHRSEFIVGSFDPAGKYPPPAADGREQKTTQLPGGSLDITRRLERWDFAH